MTNPTKRIYVSGQITGIDINIARFRFKSAENIMKARFRCKVVNPMTTSPFREGKKWDEYMIDGIKELFTCDTIYMLDGWENSKGARIELCIAKEMGKTILFQSTCAYHSGMKAENKTRFTIR